MEFRADLVDNHGDGDDGENDDDNGDEDDDNDDVDDEEMVAHMGQGWGSVDDTEAKGGLGAWIVKHL